MSKGIKMKSESNQMILSIKGLHCANCAAKIERKINEINYVKEAHIDFIKAARGEVYLDCQISRKEIDEILSATASGEKHFPQFTVRVFDENNETIAIATRTLYVRLKKEFRPQ